MGDAMTTDRLNPGMFSSNTPEWATPKEFFRVLDAEFGFTLDVCSTHQNAKCERHFTIDDDGLAQRWEGVVWMNPPYGRTISQWVRKARMSAAEGATVVCLIPARTDTAYWHEDVMLADEVRFVRGRLHFVNDELGGNAAPFPSAVVIFRPPSGVPLMASMGRGTS